MTSSNPRPDILSGSFTNGIVEGNTSAIHSQSPMGTEPSVSTTHIL